MTKIRQMKTAALLVGGISKSEHSMIHQWLRKTFGKADHCEICNRTKITND